MKHSFKMLAIAIVALVLSGGAALDARAQIISTIAGGTVNVDAGDGNPAYWATLRDPLGLAYDLTRKRLYVSSYGIGGNSSVRVIDSLGVIHSYVGTSVAGFSGDGGPATNAETRKIVYIACDSVGNLFVPDVDNWRLRRVDAATGIITTIAGNGTYGCTGDGVPATSADLKSANGAAMDAQGRIYIADPICQRVWRVDIAGFIKCIAGTGVTGYSGDGGPATAAMFNYIFNLAVDAKGNVYIPDVHNSRIRKIDTFGIVTTIAGTGALGWTGDGGPATNAKIGWPEGLAFDTAHNLFFSDQYSSTVREVDTFGIIHTIAGTDVAGYSGDGGNPTLAKLNYPSGLAFDGAGNLYIADLNNYAIRKITWHPPLAEIAPVTEQNHVRIFPNPSKDNITLSGISPGSEIILRDIVGSIVKRIPACHEEEIIPIAGLPAGMYFIKIVSPNGRTNFYKIQKE